MPSIDRKIGDVLETIKSAKERGRKCCLLIGAGCSIKAGVPLAGGFVDIIKKDWPAAYDRADNPKHYPQCMAELSLSERRDLIGRYVDKAKINWGHIAIAQLIKHKYIDRVLTTNFDPLVVRACAMVGHFPAVYDFAASQILKPADISGDAIFYLHGQRNGFVLMNTKAECDGHADKLAPLFRDAGQGRVWIVVGYSGDNDPVFKHLASVATFDDTLYWIGYKDNDPAEHVRKELLLDGKYAFHVKGFDADDFFVTVAQKLNCFPPRLIAEPFSHLDDQFKEFTEYNAPQQEQGTDITEQARKMVRNAIAKYEQPPQGGVLANSDVMPTPKLQVLKEYMAGNYAKIVEHYPADGTIPDEFRNEVSGAFIGLGNAFFEQSRQNSGVASDRLIAQATEKYVEALRIKPNSYVAFANWGLMLSEQAKLKSGAEAEQLFAQAGEKFAAALQIKSNMHQAIYNWGNMLSYQAKKTSGAEADQLFVQAGEKYAEALRIKPDLYEAIKNWGLSFIEQAKQKSGTEAEKLWEIAIEKNMRLEELKSGYGSYNLACISALQHREDECRMWLENSLLHGALPSKQHLLEDEDLACIRELDWFKAFIQDLP